MGETYLIHTCE